MALLTALGGTCISGCRVLSDLSITIYEYIVPERAYGTSLDTIEGPLAMCYLMILGDVHRNPALRLENRPVNHLVTQRPQFELQYSNTHSLAFYR